MVSTDVMTWQLMSRHGSGDVLTMLLLLCVLYVFSSDCNVLGQLWPHASLTGGTVRQGGPPCLRQHCSATGTEWHYATESRTKKPWTTQALRRHPPSSLLDQQCCSVTEQQQQHSVLLSD
jgi:hypothetical protein